MKNKPLMDRLAVSEKMQPFVDLYIEWAKKNLQAVYAAEVTVVSPNGYAGQVDCLASINNKVCVVDFKTQRYKKGKPSYWDTWPLQLAAYMDALSPEQSEKKASRIVSVTINSLEPTEVTHKVWPVKEAATALSTFKAALKIWQNTHKYKPSK
tara:strand:+ start:3578 stop:4036 length:459 start_codon:yes stop_codon:yes gene_type:complete